ncbi:MAG: hypothetical protein JMDDDDMK_01760 [Acidobacteria bacterium]|nr:hypothetical protein [Acidobacteriota bacterium]
MAWKNYECEISSKPAFIMLDDRFLHLAPVFELPQLSWFGVYCRLPPEGNLWHPDEADSLDRIEKDFIALVRAFGHGWAVYVMQIVTPGIREYYLYNSIEAEPRKAYVALKANYPDYRIEFETISDPGWDQYKRYADKSSA